MAKRARVLACEACRVVLLRRRADTARCPSCGVPCAAAPQGLVALRDGRLRLLKAGWRLGRVKETEARAPASPPPREPPEPPPVASSAAPLDARGALDALESERIEAPPAPAAEQGPTRGDSLFQERGALPSSVEAALFGASQPEFGAEAPAEGPFERPLSFGPYTLRGVLGKGGMGVVYRAFDPSLGREVALKLMSSRISSDEDRARFQREARAAARLTHPNIVPVFNIGQQRGCDYFTLGLIEGHDLHALAISRAVELRESASIVAKVARAIHYAHGQQVLHRDLKPQNILIDVAGEPHVTDFGLAKDLRDSVDLTTAGLALGSPPYMPPEQALGDYDRVDARSDVYGLGAVLYECLTGRPPFTGRSAYEIVARVQTEEPRRPRDIDPDIPIDLETICLKALDKDRLERYSSAESLARDLERFLAGESIHAYPVPLTTRVVRRVVKYRFQLASLALSLAIAASLIVFSLALVFRRDREERGAGRPPTATIQRPGALDRGLAVVSEARYEEALEAFAELLSVGAPAPGWLARAQALVAAAPTALSSALGDALQRARMRSRSDVTEPALLLASLARGAGQVEAADARAYGRLASGLLELYAPAASPERSEVQRSFSARVDELLHGRESDRRWLALREAEGARRCAVAVLEAVAARELGRRGATVQGLDASLALIERAPERARFALAQGALTLEGGKATPRGAALLARFARRKGGLLQGLAQRLEEALPRPTNDPDQGRVQAPTIDFTGQRWSFPSEPLAAPERAGGGERGRLSGAEAIFAAAAGQLERLSELGEASLPTNAVPCFSARSYAVAWLATVYLLDSVDGRVVRRFSLPGRVLGLRSLATGELVAELAEGASGAPGRLVLLDLEADRVSWIGPAGGRGLSELERLVLDPLMSFEARLEADLALGTRGLAAALAAARREAREALAAGRPRASVLTTLEEHRASIAEAFIARNAPRLASAEGRRVWPRLRQATALCLAGQRSAARRCLAKLDTRAATPIERVAVAIDLDRLGFGEASRRVFAESLRSFFESYGYEPSLGGFGALDPGRCISAYIEELMLRGASERREGRSDKLGSLAARVRALKGWRDAFAPALAASVRARRFEQRVFGLQADKGALEPRPFEEEGGRRLDPGFAGLGLLSVIGLALLAHWVSQSMLFVALLGLSLTLLRVRRQQLQDFALLGWTDWRTRLGAWRSQPLLRLQHGAVAYLSRRDRAAFVAVLLVLLASLACHDQLIAALDRRERAPAALFLGLPGHPESLSFAARNAESAELEARSVLAFGLAAAQRDGLARELYEALASAGQPAAEFNAGLLAYRVAPATREASGLVASELSSSLPAGQPEAAWARWYLSHEVAAQERAFALDNHRFAVIDAFAPRRLTLVPPSRLERDRVALGASRWWRGVARRFFAMFVSYQGPDAIGAANARVLGAERAASLELLGRFRGEGFFLLPALLIMGLASLFLPQRTARSSALGTEASRRLRLLEGAFPGVAQFMRGESVQGLLFGSAFLFLGRHLLEGTLVKSVPYAAISRLAGELSSTEAEAAATGRLLLLLALVALYAVHILLLRRSRGREARRVAILKSSRLAAGGPALESDDLLGARGSW